MKIRITFIACDTRLEGNIWGDAENPRKGVDNKERSLVRDIGG